VRGYYSQRLAADRLKACYDLAPPRTKQYLEAEISFVLGKVSREHIVLEMGCGYGRVINRLKGEVKTVAGIDTSHESLLMAGVYLGTASSVWLARMNAVCLAFRDRVFDVTLCIQNGISAFAVDKTKLFQEAIRVTKPGGTVLFSSYSAQFWPHRLEWFEVQSAHRLIGPIDYEQTKNGLIVCEDGFRSTTLSPEDFRSLAVQVGQVPTIVEVDGSSVFCEIAVI
jgi:2-polyprenyl-6-hydroxyphenyl methylase/3-demethylubiquinone-9 3-methyltransferase